MGREIRRVPANWSHPTIEQYGRTDKQPMYDEQFSSTFEEWMKDFDRIRARIKQAPLNALRRVRIEETRRER